MLKKKEPAFFKFASFSFLQGQALGKGTQPSSPLNSLFCSKFFDFNTHNSFSFNVECKLYSGRF